MIETFAEGLIELHDSNGVVPILLNARRVAYLRPNNANGDETDGGTFVSLSDPVAYLEVIESYRDIKEALRKLP